MPTSNELIFRSVTFIHNRLFSPSNPPQKLPAGQTLRFGLLSTAAINAAAIIVPAKYHADIEIVAVAARRKEDAVAYAKAWGINQQKAYGGTEEKGGYVGYEKLLADKDVDAVYIGLPNGLHAEWTIKSLQAGKHVLVEKPFCSNAEEAREVTSAINSLVLTSPSPVLLEAFHYRFHPATLHVRDILASNKYGRIISTYARASLPGGLHANNIRFNYDLGGGAMMDLTYVLSITRFMLLGPGRGKPREIVAAEAKKAHGDPRIDEIMEASMVFEIENGDSKGDGDNGKATREVKSTVVAQLVPPKLWGVVPRLWDMPVFEVETEMAKIEFKNFIMPHVSHSITIKHKDTGNVIKTERVSSFPPSPSPSPSADDALPSQTSYGYQLMAFRDRVRGVQREGRGWVDLEDSVAQMEVIDEIYEKAGMPVRGGSLWRKKREDAKAEEGQAEVTKQGEQ